MKIKDYLNSWYALGALGAVLMCLPWSLGFSPVSLVAWLPWLYMLRGMSRRGSYWLQFARLLLPMYLWNALTVWWISGATVAGMLGAILAMGSMMAGVLTIVLWGWRMRGQTFALLLLTCIWVWYDYFFHNSEIAWSWLSMGNAWAAMPSLVQWYEYTGVLGGSLWVMLSGVLLFGLVSGVRGRPRRQTVVLGGLLLLLWVVPPVLSRAVAGEAQQLAEENPVEVVIIQPNIDPWKEKFNSLSAMEQVELMVRMADSLVTPQTRLVLCPETAIAEALWEEEMGDNPFVNHIRAFLAKHPGVVWVTGATTFRAYPNGVGRTATARPMERLEGWYYDAYNSALRIDTSQRVGRYIKSKLVVGTEMTPYPEHMQWLNHLSIDLGGIAGSLGTQPYREVFSLPSGLRFAPIICYESVFGEYCHDFIRAGADFLTVITNDAWWGDTPGFREHFSFSQLRCVETRRWMARCGNTGISAIINPLGEVVESTGWWQRRGLRGVVYPLEGETFYVRHGDFIGRIVSWMTVLLLAYLGVQTVVRRRHL
ncbi:MAG: apolipoprotein N-acyltransferase [Bacteroidia bacterium]|nr:MAG: apolipoprotein N-acyltransferase [Bacteroidia bacterium]